jgi:4a-hydroxytetrahydrobiopterin dehydratase
MRHALCGVVEEERIMTTRHHRKLDADRITRALEGLPGWTVDRGRLHRAFAFADFTTAFSWMSACALVAEEMGHHPDWSNSYSRVTVDLTTHSIGGLTEADLTLARRMDDLARELGGG